MSGWPKLVEITAMVTYSVVVYADSVQQAMDEVSTWEMAWQENADLICVSDVAVFDVRDGVPDAAHLTTARKAGTEGER